MKFVRTRIQQPRFRAALVERRLLEARLDRSLKQARLVLLVAPAGHGKTVALIRQIERLPEGTAVAWITADEELDVSSFFQCFTEALEPFNPPWRNPPDALSARLAEPQGVREVAAEFLEILGQMTIDRGLMAIDDLHRVKDERVFEFLDRLLEALPAPWAMALATQCDPPLALSRLRASRELAEFRQPDLRFTIEEIRSLCFSLGADSSTAAATSLMERTQGWPVGVCLTVGAGKDIDSPAAQQLSRRHLYQYLATEVFDSLPSELQQFLLSCSVLHELTVRRCAKVSGNLHSAVMLDEIERRSLFVSNVQAGERTLRLHELARDFLEARLMRDHPERVPELLCRAASDEPNLLRRVSMLVRAGAWVDAERLFLDATAALRVACADDGELGGLLDQFPSELRERSTALAYARALHHLAQGDFGGMVSLMDVAINGFERDGRLIEIVRARRYQALALAVIGRMDEARHVQGLTRSAAPDLEADALRVLFACWDGGLNGTCEEPGTQLHLLADLLSTGAPPALWYLCFVIFPLPFFLGRPEVGPALGRLVRGARVAAFGDVLLLDEAARIEAWVTLWQGRVNEASDLSQAAIESGRWLGRARGGRMRWIAFPSVLASVRGDRPGLDAIFENQQIEVLAQRSELRRSFLGIKAICFAAMQDWPQVREALDFTEPSWPFWGDFRELGEARLALADNRAKDAVDKLRYTVADARKNDRFGLEAGMRITLAVAELRCGARRAAWEALAPLIDQVRSSGEVGGILMCGLASLDELSQALWGFDAPPEGVQELHRWVALSRAARAVRPHTANNAADAGKPKLTLRELQVLACIADGDSNKIIARKLNLSPHTVKRHVARILDRLHLSSRIEAAGWYLKRKDLPEADPLSTSHQFLSAV